MVVTDHWLRYKDHPPGRWRCGSQSPQCCLWLDRSDDARRAPQTGEVGWVQGFKGVGQGFDLLRLVCFRKKTIGVSGLGKSSDLLGFVWD